MILFKNMDHLIRVDVAVPVEVAFFGDMIQLLQQQKVLTKLQKHLIWQSFYGFSSLVAVRKQPLTDF